MRLEGSEQQDVAVVTCVSFRAGVPGAPSCLGCEELELRKDKVLGGGAQELLERSRALLRV